MAVHTALISGPRYERLYACLADFTRSTGIEGVQQFSGDHPAVNAHLVDLAAQHGANLPLDLVSTHTKYAPSQVDFLAPLDEVPGITLKDFADGPLALARIGGRLYGLPRNIDLRLLHFRSDLIPAPPPTWDALLSQARTVNHPPSLYGFVFPGMESGLFGTFYELCEAAGAHLFPPTLVPDVCNDAGRWALSFLRTAYAESLVPPEITHWHYDKVHDCFRDGHAAMVGDWPGYYSDHTNAATSAVAGRFALALYPVGPSGRSRVYGGCHTFALTHRGAGNPDAVALLHFLTAPEQQMAEASGGSVPVRESVMAAVQAAAGPVDRHRWQLLARAMQDVVIPPKFGRYPQVEELLWRTVQAAMVGDLAVDDALRLMTEQIQAITASVRAESAPAIVSSARTEGP
ncbi:MAG: extracellular solute-binding protein [Caldilineaceae bacterium]